MFSPLWGELEGGISIVISDRFSKSLFWTKTVDNQSNFGGYVTAQNLLGLKIGSIGPK